MGSGIPTDEPDRGADAGTRFSTVAFEATTGLSRILAWFFKVMSPSIIIGIVLALEQSTERMSGNMMQTRSHKEQWLLIADWLLSMQSADCAITLDSLTPHVIEKKRHN